MRSVAEHPIRHRSREFNYNAILSDLFKSRWKTGGYRTCTRVCDCALDANGGTLWRMGVAPNQSSVSDPFSSSEREPSPSSPPASSSPVVSQAPETALSSRHVLPKDLDTAIRQLDDQELERLLLVALEERSRRKKIAAPEKNQRERQIESIAVSLPQGKLNAIRAAFKAGVTPSRISREFGISQSDVRKALAPGQVRR